jgi:hypothetical protein
MAEMDNILLGRDLSNNPYVDYLLADDPDHLVTLLRQIRLPYRVLGMMPFGGGRILAIVSPSQPLKKVLPPEPSQELSKHKDLVSEPMKKKPKRKKQINFLKE